MSGGLTVAGQLPDAILMLGRLDAEVSRAVTAVRGEALDAYRQSAPGRVAGGVEVRRSSKTGQKLTVTIAKVPMGGKQSGRDVGTQAVAYWTNFGTKTPIRMTKPVRLRNDVIVQEVRGQPAQGWVAEAKRQADASAQVLIDQHLEGKVTDLLERL
jgi:hypothetical protein